MFLLHGVNEGLERSHKKRDHIQKPWRRFGGKHREARVHHPECAL